MFEGKKRISPHTLQDIFHAVGDDLKIVDQAFLLTMEKAGFVCYLSVLKLAR